MMTHFTNTQRWRVVLRAVGTGAFALAGVAASACNLDKALKVQDVDVALPPVLEGKAGLPPLYAGARSEVEVAIGSTDGAVTFPGLLADELRDIDTFPTRIEVDLRNTQINNGTLQTWYRQMHLARRAIERATTAFTQFDASNAQRAELHALNGFLYTMFAEDFCNGVSYNRFDANGVAQYGEPMTGDASLTLGLSQFDSATNVAKPGANELNLAAVGRGRALLDQGKFAEAAAAVANVPVTFQYFVYFSENSGRENNGIYVNVGPVSKRFAVADRDAVNTIPFRSLGWDQASVTTANPNGTGDIRVRWYRSGIGQDGVSTAYYTLKYPNRSAKVVLADGIEAQLIIAENQLRTNDPGWLTTLNNLRGNSALLTREPYTQAGQVGPSTLTPLSDPGTPDSRLDMLYQERALWMYLTGHRLGDMRRLVRVYGRSVASVFPSGTYAGAAGGQFGGDVNFPITVDEQNNGNAAAKQCTDRNP